MQDATVQCGNCGFIAVLPQPRLLEATGWRLQSARSPGTYCPECAAKLGVPERERVLQKTMVAGGE